MQFKKDDDNFKSGNQKYNETLKRMLIYTLVLIILLIFVIVMIPIVMNIRESEIWKNSRSKFLTN